MKKRKNPLIIVALIATVIIVFVIVAKVMGLELFSTLSGENANKPNAYSSVNELESGKAYVWHHKGGDIQKDLKKDANESIFFTCIKGDYNFKKKEMEEAIEHPRSIWVGSDIDDQIPTVTSDDLLIYVSTTEVPDGILFERFADYGYSIGVSNLIKDGGGHYYIDYASTDEDDYKFSVDMNSDAAALSELESVNRLYLDKVGDEKVTKNNVSDGGSVLNLTKDKSYVCEFYTGTYYQDFKMTANIHTFSSLERFISYEYEFMHSNFIVIKIPDYFKSGYYFVNGVGLFRYVSDADVKSYNGLSYDEGIDWNDPIIIYSENGEVIENPSDPEFVKPDYMESVSDPGIKDETELEVKRENKTSDEGEE